MIVNLPFAGSSAAGTVRTTLVSESTVEDFRALFKAKIDGAWLLHDILKQQPLDFFVLFSSASAVLSSPRLGPYAASNAFLDALADYRGSIGLPALSVNWGVWSDAGMATRSAASTARTVSERGMGAMRTAEGLHCLGRLIGNTQGQVCVMPVDWQKWAAFTGIYVQALFFKLRTEGPADSGPSPAAQGRAIEPGSSHLHGLLAFAPEEREKQLVRYLTDTIPDPRHPGGDGRFLLPHHRFWP